MMALNKEQITTELTRLRGLSLTCSTWGEQKALQKSLYPLWRTCLEIGMAAEYREVSNAIAAMGFTPEDADTSEESFLNILHRLGEGENPKELAVELLDVHRDKGDRAEMLFSLLIASAGKSPYVLPEDWARRSKRRQYTDIFLALH